MADRDFDLRIRKAGSHYLTDVRSPDGEEANHAFELPISPERLDELFRGLGHPRKATRGGGSPEVQQARDVGRQLFETVFAGEIRDVFQRSLGRVEARGGDLRIRLRLARDVPELLGLPWELLFDQGRNRFLALERATTLVRHLPVQQRIEPMRVAPPLHILVAISNPGRVGYPTLDVEQEWANLDRALRPLRDRGRVSLTRLDGVTQESLRQALKRDACHVLHYIGHGGYDSASETGHLVLEDKDGGARSCGASRLTFLLCEQPALRLVVLNACEGGRSSHTDPFAGVAQSLVQGAIPAVVAMQFPVTDAAAVVLATAFYEALASGRPVDLALAAARREVNLSGEEGEIEWATPVLYMRGDGDLFSFEEREPAPPTAPIPVPGPNLKRRKILFVAVVVTLGAVYPVREILKSGRQTKSTQAPIQQTTHPRKPRFRLGSAANYIAQNALPYTFYQNPKSNIIHYVSREKIIPGVNRGWSSNVRSPGQGDGRSNRPQLSIPLTWVG